VTTYTEEDIKRMYQLGYSHGANGQPPLDGGQVLRVAELGHAGPQPKDDKP
jgi:hypothetical protein